MVATSHFKNYKDFNYLYKLFNININMKITQFNLSQQTQSFYNTYYSSTLEKHAKPNSFINFSAHYYFHPNLDTIPEEAINNYPQLKELFDEFILMGFISYDKESKVYKRVQPYGFPRQLLCINTPLAYLIPLSKERNPKHYNKLDEFLKKFRNKKMRNKIKLYQNFIHTLDNIRVADIQDKPMLRSKGYAYERTIGTEDLVNDVIAYGNFDSTLFAATKRQLKMCPTPDPLVVQDFIRYAKKIIDKELGEQLQNFSYDYAQWYNHLTSAKQKEINKVFDFHHRPERFLEYSPKERYDATRLNYEAIVKKEIQPEDGKPRMVCSIPQRIKYAMGPICWKLEEICQNYLKGYCGGKNLQQMADDINKYISEGFTKVAEGDGSAFDNTQDVMLKEIDRYLYSQIYHSVYHVPLEEFKMISNLHYKCMKVKTGLNNQLKTILTYYILGTVFSGDSDTTLCNTVRMCLYNRYINDRSGLKYGKDYILFSKGDDFTVCYQNYIKDEFIKQIYYTYFVPKSDAPDEIDTRIAGLGQVLKFLDIGGPDSFHFCSLKSYYTNDSNTSVVLTREPDKLYKESMYSIKYKTYNPTMRAAYHYDQCVNYLKTYPHIQIFEIPAIAHFKKYLLYTTHPEFNYKKFNGNLVQLLHKHTKAGEARETIRDINTLIPYAQFYETQGRDKYYKIIGTYWDTMKKLLEVNRKLSDNEIELVNAQISTSYDLNLLKEQLGVTDNDVKNVHEIYTYISKTSSDVATRKINSLKYEC